jgi:hypothetical protein
MKLAECSRDKFRATFEHWRVDKDFADPIYNYLVYGWNPGSFFTAVLANDFRRAIQASHPANNVNSLKALVGWIGDHAPHKSWGSYEDVKAWEAMTDAERRELLEYRNLIYTEKEEMWKILKESA